MNSSANLLGISSDSSLVLSDTELAVVTPAPPPVHSTVLTSSLRGAMTGPASTGESITRTHRHTLVGIPDNPSAGDLFPKHGSAKIEGGGLVPGISGSRGYATPRLFIFCFKLYLKTISNINFIVLRLLTHARNLTVAEKMNLLSEAEDFGASSINMSGISTPWSRQIDLSQSQKAYTQISQIPLPPKIQ